MKFTENPEAGGTEFLKIKSGESIRLIFRGEPFTFKTHWNGKTSIVCKGPACTICEEGGRPKFRFRLNVLVSDGNGYVPKVFEQGATVYQTLKNLNDDYDLDRTVVKISRQGSGLNDTVYTILPVPGPNGTLTDETLSKIRTIPLLPLDQFKAEDSSMGEGRQDQVMTEGDLPF